jgi:glycosyltransferase involved in cell wall biosynthesis
MLVSVVIPCKNEPYVNTLIDAIHDSLSYPHEILIQTEPGLASAVFFGIKKSKGDVIAVLDADGSHNPRDLNAMISLLPTFPVVIGSRYVEGGFTDDFLIRQFVSRLFCKMAQIILKLEIRDTMSGFVVAKRQVFEALQLKPIGYKFALELMVKSNGRFRIGEYPIVFEKRKIGVSKTGIGQGIRTISFIALLYLWKLCSGNHRVDSSEF